MRIVRPVVFALSIGFLGLAAGQAEAATACFDWSCDDSTYLCTFDASCSVGLPYIWKYNFFFGDGNSSGLIGSSTTQHQYAWGDPHPDVKLLIVPQWEDVTEVTCEILIYNIVGPPLPTSGRCTE